jgi:nonsense-mediated mRNA decay protein 3
MSEMFCVECGKEGPIFKDGVCVECYLKTHTFTKGPDSIDLPICTNCGSYKYKNTWTSGLFGDVMQRIIKNTFQIYRELKKIDINTECKEIKEGMSCKIYISGILEDQEITEEHEIIVHQKRTVCDVCSKQFGGYHEAIVQIRTDKRELTKSESDEMISLVGNLVEDIRAKGNRGLFITDIAKEHKGLDFFVSEKGPSLVIAKAIHDRYGGTMKHSSKNIGMKDGRQVYRMTYLIRLPSFKKGDFIKQGDSFFNIISVHGNKVKLLDLSNWEENTLDLNNIQKANIIGNELIKEMILVSQTKDELQLMDPDSYKIQTIKKPKQINLKTEKIKVLKTEKQLLLLPTKTLK